MKNVLLMAIVCLFCWACGGENTSESETTTPTESQVKEAPKVEEPAPTPTEESTDESFDVEVALAGGDDMRYDKAEIKVKAGQKVKLTLTHTGKLPKTAMGHNFVLLKPGVVLSFFGTQAAKASDNDYIPEDTEDVIAHTKMVGGGESTSIVFDAPEAGTYEYMCSFPGHYGLMQGKFIVE